MQSFQDECSYVSLRDVERAMIVFKHFCDDQQNSFQELIDEMTVRKVSYNSHSLKWFVIHIINFN